MALTVCYELLDVPKHALKFSAKNLPPHMRDDQWRETDGRRSSFEMGLRANGTAPVGLAAFVD